VCICHCELVGPSLGEVPFVLYVEIPPPPPPPVPLRVINQPDCCTFMKRAVDHFAKNTGVMAFALAKGRIQRGCGHQSSAPLPTLWEPPRLGFSYIHTSAQPRRRRRNPLGWHARTNGHIHIRKVDDDNEREAVKSGIIMSFHFIPSRQMHAVVYAFNKLQLKNLT
jgi:hypothetical protein